MKHTDWMQEAERLLNAMEKLDYKSESYKQCRATLKAHLAAKPPVEEDEDFLDSNVWSMTSPNAYLSA